MGNTLAIITDLLGTLCLARVVEGMVTAPGNPSGKSLAAACSFLLIKPGWFTDLIGFSLLVIVALLQFLRGQKDKYYGFTSNRCNPRGMELEMK